MLSLPVAYSDHLKEMYEIMFLLLEKIRYRKYNWNICGHLNVATILMGQDTPSTAALSASGTERLTAPSYKQYGERFHQDIAVMDHDIRVDGG